MQTKTNKDFKAVEFMRQVRNELSGIYQTDKVRYYNELKNAMRDFINHKTHIVANEPDSTYKNNSSQ